MRSSTAFLLATSASCLLLLLSGAAVHATVATTCRAAADSDRRISYDFCVSELSKGPDRPGVAEHGLAKVAVDLGETDAKKAGGVIRDLLAQPGNAAKAKKKALEECHGFYGVAELGYRRAYDRIIDRKNAAAKEQVALAISQALKCDDALAKGAVDPSPALKQHSFYTVHICIISTAIMNLIK